MRLSSTADSTFPGADAVQLHEIYSSIFGVTQEIAVSQASNEWLHNLLQSSTGSKHAAATDSSPSEIRMNTFSEGSSFSGQLPQQIYESTVNLSFGGRTHQIRAQLAAIGAPVIGDVMYGAIAGATVSDSAIADNDLIRRIDDCSQVDGPIGLHAYSMTWEDRTYKAVTPWEE